MSVPSRAGLETTRWMHALAGLDRDREAELRQIADPTDAGGRAVLWHLANSAPSTLRIQPGVADDLPALLSSLAPEIAWPGAPALAGKTVVAVWARVWQVRERADLRVTLHWNTEGHFAAQAELRAPDGAITPLLNTTSFVALLDRVAATPHSSTAPHALVLAGNRAMQAGDFAAARDLYRRAITDLPRHPQAHRNLALALARLGEWEAAAAIMQQALALASHDPGLSEEYLALETDAGIDAARHDDLERAAGHFLRILTLWPDEPTALANLGNIRLRERRSPEARAIYRRFLRHHPHHPVADKIRLALQELGGDEA